MGLGNHLGHYVGRHHFSDSLYGEINILTIDTISAITAMDVVIQYGTQKSMELGLMEIKETSISHADGHVSISKTPKITGKGQQYFIGKFLKQ